VTAIDAYFMRQEVLDTLRTPWWAGFAFNFTASMRGEVPGTLGGGINITAQRFTDMVHETLTLAESYYVDPPMHALVGAAAESWPDDEPIDVADFPTDQGWMWMPGAGLVALDVRGQLLHCNALSWDRRGNEVTLIWWAHKRWDPPPVRASNPEAWERMPMVTPWHVFTMTIGKPLPQSLQMGTVLPWEVSQEIRYARTEQGYAMYFPQGWTPEQMTPSLRRDDVAAWLISALRIMQTTLASVERQGLPANVRRNLRRHPHRLRQTAVTVIQLRRRAGSGETGEGRVYSHRWLRRGHWRKQWYGSERNGDRRQVRIYIHPTLCGPEGAPVILRGHVQALTR